MKIIVAGLDHRSAPIEIREKLAFDAAGALSALRQLKSRFSEAEFVLLSTCNRVELYCADKRAGGVRSQDLAEFLAQFQDVSLEDFQDCLYVHEDEEAVVHLLMVASSLDSMVVGEGQIIGQAKESYRLACMAKSTGKILNRLFHCAFATSKKIHSTTSISSGRVSVAGVAVELAKQLFADISSAKVVVIGAGEMGQLVLQHLLHVGCRDITVVNRSYERARRQAESCGVGAGKWEDLEEQLVCCNIAIASASVQEYLFTKSTVEKIMSGRRKGARRKASCGLLIIDIAVPRNFEPAVEKIEDVYLYSIDDLSGVAEQNRKVREQDIARGMALIYENAAGFMDWFGARDIGPLIGQMKEKFSRIGRSELERFFVGARRDASCKEAMEKMVNRLVNKLLHCVIKNVDVVAKEQGPAEAAKLVDSIVRQAEEISSGQGDNNKDTQS